MQTIKEEVREIIEKLPDDCSLEDIQYHLYVLQKIENGLKDVEDGRVISHEDIEKKMQNGLLIKVVFIMSRGDIVKKNIRKQ